MAEITVTKSNFEQEVLRADKPVLVDFWASWCGPCRMLAPTLSEIAEEYEGHIRVGKVNVDDEPELAAKYGVSVIPTLMLFKNGSASGSMVGAQPKEKIEQLIK